MDPKHVLIRLGLLYLKDHGDRTAIHKSAFDRPLAEAIAAVKTVEQDNGFIMVWMKLS